jgi:hypothetical protein
MGFNGERFTTRPTSIGLGVAKPDLGLDLRRVRLIGFGKRLGLIGLAMLLFGVKF